jgi:hypothetical protein
MNIAVAVHATSRMVASVGTARRLARQEFGLLSWAGNAERAMAGGSAKGDRVGALSYSNEPAGNRASGASSNMSSLRYNNVMGHTSCSCPFGRRAHGR